MIKNIIKFFFIIAFCQGLLFYIGIPNIIYKQIILIFTFLLVIIFLILKNKLDFEKRHDRTFKILLFLNLLIFFASFVINSSPNIPSLSYLLYFLPGFLIYFLIRKKIFEFKELKNLNTLFFVVFLIQIFASIIKLIFIGTQEAIVGTIHYSGGALNTIVPLIGISMLSSFYLFHKNDKMYLFLILGFIFMGWTGEKRGIYFYLIILFLFGYFSYLVFLKVNFKSQLKIIFVRLPFIVLILYAIFYFGVRFSPTLNPERIVGGSFDMDHVSEYIYQYSYRTNEDGLGIGRLSGLSTSFDYFITKSDLKTLFFGQGPSTLVGQFDDVNSTQFGVASYLGINGWTTSLISTGFFGAILFSLIYFFISYNCYKVFLIEKNKYWRSVIFGTYLICFVFMLDFFTYTRASFNSVPLNLILLYFFSVIMNRYDNLKHNKIKI